MLIKYSIIIPIYNRPQELDELLHSLVLQTFEGEFEVVVVEDGSSDTSKEVVASYSSKLAIRYFLKENTGAGRSRNFGMKEATGDYFIILDSDCVLPENYLANVAKALAENYTDAYGGADAAHSSFTTIQKAISYTMTSILTTGGIRGNKNLKGRFQPRSFNMGISKIAYEKTKGYGNQHFGEDIDLAFRLWNHGFESQFIENAFVYHKRRTTWSSFFKQTFNFGAARPILNELHPSTAKITYWFPSVFILGFLIATIGLFFQVNLLFYAYLVYLIFIAVDSLLQNKSITVALASVVAVLVQFAGYGTGFLRSMFRLKLARRSVKETFPRMFS